MGLRAQLHVSPRGRLEHPELALARGPVAEGETGDGSLSALYGYRWALVWDRTRPELVLCRVEGAELVEVEPLEPLPALTVPARHIALAFDGSARPMIAWQGRDGIRVRQWDHGAGRYTVRGPFPGQDPVLVPDAPVRGATGDADVLLFHLRDDRGELVVRLERDVYGVAYSLAELAPAPSGRPWYLDQVTDAGLRLQVHLATDDVSAATRGLPAAEQELERLTLVSEPYTLQPRAPAALTLTARGHYEATTVTDSLPPEAAAVALAARGVFTSSMYQRVTAAAADMALTARGTYEETPLIEEPDAVALVLAARGEYQQL